MTKMTQEEINQTLSDENRKLRDKVKQLKMDKEDMYQLATRAEWNEDDWADFQRIFTKY